MSAPTSSGLGIATATLSPAASYKIGQYFKEQANNNANGQLTSGQEAAHIFLAHTVLGAAVAAAGGNNALTAGLSAGGTEAAPPVLSSFLYGKDAKDLTADQKSTISSIVGLAGSAVGATTGDIGSTVQSGQVAQNAVENNALENVLLPHEINDQNGQYAKEQLQAIKDNSTYKVNADGDFIICVKVAGSSCAPREGERYATQQEILEKGGEAVATTAASWGATKVLEPIVVVAKDSGVWSKVVGTVKEWFGTGNKISTNGVINEIQHLDPNNVRFSQNTVSFNKTDRVTGETYTYNDLVESMRKNGWQGDAVDVVKMPDGAVTSFDNTRISAAREAGIDIKANIRNPEEPLPIDMMESGRFGEAKTWGEAITNRINNQRPKSFSQNNPNGTLDQPRITGKPK